jgi:hypothetical protein
MKAVRVVCAALVTAGIAATAAADVTLKTKTGGKMMTMSLDGTGVQYIKGSRMRQDQSNAMAQMSTIIDINAQQMIVLNHANKEAEVYDFRTVSAAMSKVPMTDMKARVTPKGQTRQIAGSSCTVHDIDVTVPFDMGGEKLTFLISGPACLAKNHPGAGEMAAFFKLASEKGLFFGDPRAAKVQPAQAKGMMALYKEMSALGVPLSQEINVTFQGEGQMAAMMGKMGASTMTYEVVSASTDPVPDSTFEIPAGYKVTTR